MKEKTCVCIGIFLILALLCSCALFYGVTGAADVAVHAGNLAGNGFVPASVYSETLSSPFSGNASPLSAVRSGS